MPQGYVNGKPEWRYWKHQIERAKEFRRKAAYEADWKRWDEYYRGEWRGDVLPVNLFFTMLRTIVPRIYFRNPSLSIRPGKPGFENAVFAKILERVDGKLIRQMDFKRQIRRCIQETWMRGTGFMKNGFGTEFDPIVEISKGKAQTRKEALEYNSFVQPGMPWVMKCGTGQILMPEKCQHPSEARWMAERIRRSADDVRADTRLRNRNKIKPHIDRRFGKPKDEQEKDIELWEIRDKKTGRVFVLTKNVDGAEDNINHLLLDGEDFFLMERNSFAWKRMVFNEDNERCWGVPDSKILEPYQLEINEIKTQLMFHRRAATAKIIARVNSISKEEAQKLVDESILPVVYTNGDPNRDLKIVESMPVPPELRQLAVEVIQDMRETVGFGRNQFGEFNPRSGDTTATEAQIVRQASEIRIDERRDIVADFMLDVFADVHAVIFGFWRSEQVVDLVGPGAEPIWIRFTGTDLANSAFSIEIDPDNSVPETKAIREQRAVQVFQLLRTNPLIDPIQLTRYLLTNFHGTQFDDLMAALPPIPQGAQVGPINPQQLPQVIEQRVNALPAPIQAGSA